MTRGNIQLTTAELALAHQLAQADMNHRHLAVKLTPTTEQKNWDVELSFDEVEFLLDTLPTPSSIQSADIKNVRSKLQAWLAQYHQVSNA